MLQILRSSEKKPSFKATVKTEKKFGLQEGNFVLCSNCGSIITRPERIVAVNGYSQHTFTNPAGFTYDIVCFSSASGCISYGEFTPEHTWFQGFNWCYTLCANCLVHLGWFYQNAEESFFGLILDRIVETTKTH